MITTEILADTPEYRDVHEYDDVARTETLRREWKPGTAPYNRDQLLGKAQQALTINATYLALASPSTAQSAAQIKALTREVNALIRLLLDEFDDISGT